MTEQLGQRHRPQLVLADEVLCPGVHRRLRDLVVLGPGEHHDRHGWCLLLQPVQRLQALAVGQAEVQEHDVGLRPGDVVDSLLEPVDAFDHDPSVPGVDVRLVPQEHRIGVVVLDEQGADRCHDDRPGRTTTWNQNVSIALTISANWSRPIGLVT